MAFAEEKIHIQLLQGMFLVHAEKRHKIHINYQMIYKSNSFKTKSVICLLFQIAVSDGK